MIRINLDKAKAIAHDRRRTARAREFAPLDVEATIPAKAAAAEAPHCVATASLAPSGTGHKGWNRLG